VFHGLRVSRFGLDPSNKLLDYCHFVRFADEPPTEWVETPGFSQVTNVGDVLETV
jgi:hypothetical protein